MLLAIIPPLQYSHTLLYISKHEGCVTVCWVPCVASLGARMRGLPVRGTFFFSLFLFFFFVKLVCETQVLMNASCLHIILLYICICVGKLKGIEGFILSELLKGTRHTKETISS